MINSLSSVIINPIKINSINKNNTVSFPSHPSFKSSFPDLKQYEIRGMGEYYCGPVSAANGIIMLAQRGFSRLYQPQDSKSLINELARYFKTDKNGTTTANMIDGLQSFVNAKGYNSKLKYQGFRPIDPKYKITTIPNFDWIKNEINKDNAVFLNLGIYKKNIQDGKTIYTRQYGHFVTATGQGSNGISIEPNGLTIHDPYNRVHGDHHIKVQEITQGKFIHNSDDNEISLTDNAAGFYEISPKFNYLAPDEVGIINGVVSLEMVK